MAELDEVTEVWGSAEPSLPHRRPYVPPAVWYAPARDAQHHPGGEVGQDVGQMVEQAGELPDRQPLPGRQPAEEVSVTEVCKRA